MKLSETSIQILEQRYHEAIEWEKYCIEDVKLKIRELNKSHKQLMQQVEIIRQLQNDLINAGYQEEQ